MHSRLAITREYMGNSENHNYEPRGVGKRRKRARRGKGERAIYIEEDFFQNPRKRWGNKRALTSARGSWRMVQLAGDCPLVGWADARTLSSRRIGSTRRRCGLTPVKHIASHTNRGSRWDTVERVRLLYRGWPRACAVSFRFALPTAPGTYDRLPLPPKETARKSERSKQRRNSAFLGSLASRESIGRIE